LSRRLMQEGHDVVHIRSFEQLLARLQRRESGPLTIVHCAGFGAPAAKSWQLDEAWLERGVHSLILLAQTLQKHPLEPGTSLRIVANEVFDVPGGRPVRPEK